MLQSPKPVLFVPCMRREQVDPVCVGRRVENHDWKLLTPSSFAILSHLIWDQRKCTISNISCYINHWTHSVGVGVVIVHLQIEFKVVDEMYHCLHPLAWVVGSGVIGQRGSKTLTLQRCRDMIIITLYTTRALKCTTLGIYYSSVACYEL